VGGKASARTSGRQAAALVITAFAGACGGGGDDDTKNGRAKASSLPLAANGMIAFSRSENVYVADASGRSVERMTSGPGRGARGPLLLRGCVGPGRNPSGIPACYVPHPRVRRRRRLPGRGYGPLGCARSREGRCRGTRRRTFPKQGRLAALGAQRRSSVVCHRLDCSAQATVSARNEPSTGSILSSFRLGRPMYGEAVSMRMQFGLFRCRSGRRGA
jgi:hypothetical protein